MWRKYDWPALAATFALIVVVRESCVWLTGLFHHPELGNLLGLPTVGACCGFLPHFGTR